MSRAPLIGLLPHSTARSMHDPVFDPLRAAPVPDSFEDQMARLRAHPPQRSPVTARALALAAALAVVVGACAVPVTIERPLGYAVRWSVSGVTDDSHPSAQALEAAVPPPDRLLSTVEPGEDGTAFQTVVTGPPPDLQKLREVAGVSGVRVEPLVEPVRVPLGAWVADRLGVSRSVTVGLGSPRLSDAEVARLLGGQLAAVGIDTTAIGVTVGRGGDGRRSLGLRVRTARDRISEFDVPVGPDTRVRTWGDGFVMVEGLPPGAQIDTTAFEGTRRIVWRDPTGRGRPTRAQMDSLLRANGHDDLADSLRRRSRDGAPR